MYHPVVQFPPSYEVFDLTKADAVEGMHGQVWGIGKYNEKREAVYSQFYHGDRNIHVGVDLFGPVETPVHAFTDGTLLSMANNSTPGDYGYTLIYEHTLEDGQTIYALYGHLGAAALDGKAIGQAVKAGDVVGKMGNQEENGGWPPHVHFQLSIVKPEVCDMPGVVSSEQLASALEQYPDPRTVLGPIF